MSTTRPKIIIVDDNATYVSYLLYSLSTAFPDFEVVGLCSREDFQDYLCTTCDADIAIVVTDECLSDDPFERGSDLLLYCRQQLPHVRRVLMSQMASRAELGDAINRCALDGYYEKRFDPDKLIGLLRLLVTDVEKAAPVNDRTARKTCDRLNRISPGSQSQANLYKTSIRDLIAYVFYPWLVAPRTEVPIRNETKAVDIVLQNAARDGILADLKRRYDSLLVPVETKNSKTLHSSYFSQLEGYLTKPVGKWGILCFRGRIEPKHLQQVKAAHNEGKFLMLLTDSDLVELAKAKISGRQSRDDFSATLDQFMRKKFDESIG